LTHARRERYTARVRPKQVRAAVYAIFSMVASAFVVSSTAQIIYGVFGSDGSSSEAKLISPECKAALTEFDQRITRGITAASTATSRAEAERMYREARGPAWDEPSESSSSTAATARAQACASPRPDSPHVHAVAAIRQWDRAAEGSARRQADELAPVRRAVDSFIR